MHVGAQALNAGFQHLELQRRCLFHRLRVQRLDAAQGVAHLGRLGRVDKAALLVPLGECRQVRAQRAGGQPCPEGRQVAHHADARRRQQPAPLPFEVLDGLGVAARGAGPACRLLIPLRVAHLTSRVPRLRAESR
ncbi:hypothetical protein D3C80_742880 [compost metagenome]